jgi:SulP family sulfate permease
MIMPTVIFTVMGFFYLLTWITKTSIVDLSSQGWLLATLPHEKLWHPISFSGLAGVHWENIWSQLGNIGIVLIISTISLLLNISGLELIAHEDMDLNRELKVAGIANFAAGIGGSHTAYHTLSLSTLGIKMGSNSRFVGLFAALMCGMALWFGASILTFFPKFILGGLILFLGLSFVVEWVYDAWFKLSKVDYFLVLFILIIIGLFGFLAGVGVGMVTAVLIFTVNYSRINVINRTLSEVTMRSNVDRPELQRQFLKERGPQVYILKLQGFIFFGTAHTLYQEVNARVHTTTLPAVRHVVFDFRRVTGLDGSAELSFMKIIRLAKTHNFRVIFTDLSSRFHRKLSRTFTGESESERVLFFPDLDHGIEWCEDQILLSEQASLFEKPLSFQSLLGSIFLEQNQIETLLRYLEKKEVESGSFLIRQGERSEYLYFVESGEFAAQLELEGEEPIRLRTMHAGAIFGEIALYLNIPRSVSIIAVQPSVVYRLSTSELKRMETEDPGLAVTFQNYVIRLLAERLVDLNRTLEALSD